MELGLQDGDSRKFMSTACAHSGLDNEEGMPVTEMRIQASQSPCWFCEGQGAGREQRIMRWHLVRDTTYLSDRARCSCLSNSILQQHTGVPGGSVGKHPPTNAGGVGGSIPGQGRSPGGGNGNSLQQSSLENPMDRGAWWAAVQRVAESDTTEHICMQSTESLTLRQSFKSWLSH